MPVSRKKKPLRIHQAQWLPTTPACIAGRTSRHTPAQKAGLRYEKKVLDAVDKQDVLLMRGQWFSYWTHLGLRKQFCQPDGIVVDYTNRGITLIEIKYSPTSAAYEQLMFLYKPVMQAILDQRWFINTLMVFRNIDPTVEFPEKPVNLYSLEVIKEFTKKPQYKIGQAQWRP